MVKYLKEDWSAASLEMHRRKNLIGDWKDSKLSKKLI